MECNDTAERMNWCLECINLKDGKLRGTKMKYEVVNGILHYFVNYDFFIEKPKNVTAMEAMGTNTNVKEGE